MNLVKPLYGEHDEIQIERIDSGDDRYYICEDRLYISATTFINKILLPNKYTQEWVAKHGSPHIAKVELKKLADYGTFYGIQCCNVLMNREIPVDENLRQYIIDYGKRHRVIVDLTTWLDRFPDEIMSFTKFVQERDVTPINLELPVINKKMGYAGCLDLLCEMNWNKKRVKAIVDIKSGKIGNYATHQAQLLAYQIAYNQMYSNKAKVTHIFNLAPKNWKKEATYFLINQTRKFSVKKLQAIFELNKPDKKKTISIKRYKGNLNVNSNLNDLFEIINYEAFNEINNEKI